MSITRLTSLHFIPAHEKKFLEHLRNNKISPSAIIFDLEDGVPHHQKKNARDTLTQMLEENRDYLQDIFLIIRINSRETDFFLEDISFLGDLIKNTKIHGIMLPKVVDPSEIIDVKGRFGDLSLFVIIESIEGVTNASQIINAMDNKKDAVVIGYEDLCLDMMMERPENIYSFNPISAMVFSILMACRKEKINIFDGVCRKFRIVDITYLIQECEYAAQLFFTGKLSIHPNQIRIIEKIFSKQNLLSQSREILEHFGEGTKEEKAVINFNGNMLDTPSKKLHKILVYSYS